MRILFVSHSANLAGAERAMVDLIREARGRGHDVQAFVPRRGQLSDAIGRIRGARANVVPMHWWMSGRGGGIVGLIRVALCVLETPIVGLAIWRAKPDVILVNTSVTPAAMFAGSLSRAGTVVMVRESLITNPSLASVLPKGLIVRLIRKWADEIVAVSAYVAGQCGTNVVIHDGVPPFTAERVPGSPGVLRAVYLGSLTADKCPDEAVEAVRMARAAGADVRLSIYGGGTRQEVEQLGDRIAASRIAEYVTYRGEIDGPGPALAHAEVLLMTSRNEAFGRVTVEALIGGVPVVGYDAGGTREILAGGGGVLVAPNPSALAEVLISLWQDADRLSAMSERALQSGREWVDRRSDKAAIDLIEKVFNDVRPR